MWQPLPQALSNTVKEYMPSNEQAYFVAAYLGSVLVWEEETYSYREALEIAEDMLGEYQVVIYHPDGEEEELQ